MIAIHPLTADDLPAAAEVHVTSWRAAYAAILPADYLDALDPVKFAAHPLRLWVLEDNARARRFYERVGFTADGMRDLWTPRGTTVTVPELRYSMAL
ncbi:N-acetyltransferase [Actinoplanes sp. TFC3]|uniref:N-acetyltransferase n=1 Tax=Actinoplanes sp. TFC3 TaxID=1710355 RepID=UPI0008317B02|nr:N-acetyltransferase [Actinoplanes sp. TFC3]